MSNRAIDWALSQEIKSPEKCVLLVLANRANHQFQCWPSHRDIIFQSGYGETTVKNALKRLRRKKLIRWQHRPTPKGGLSSNLYTLLYSEKNQNRRTPGRETTHPPTGDDPPPRRGTSPPKAGDAYKPSLNPKLKLNGTAPTSSILKVGKRVGKIHKLKS